MSSVADKVNLNNSASASKSARRRSATVTVPPTQSTNPNVHVSVSVSLSESLASISAWASQIAPGAPPATPSPRRSSFISLSPKAFARSPKTPRRNSVSATFFNLRDSPPAQPQTPAPKPVSPADLLAQGYTSVFVHLPSDHRDSEYAESIPDSPSLQYRENKTPLFLTHAQPRSRTKSVTAEAGKREDKPSSFARLRSLSFKAKTPKTTNTMAIFNAPSVPPLPSHKPSTRPPSHRSAHARKPKSTPQTRYGAILGSGGGTGALPLAQEIALAQMLDGGSFDVNVRRVTERHARATGTHNHNIKPSSARDEVYKKSRKDRRPIEKREGIEHGGKVGAGVSGVYRDPQGNLWWDEDESLELAGLLPDSNGLSQSQTGQMPLSNSTLHNQEKEKRRGLLPRLMTSAKPPPSTALPAPPSWVPLHSPVATGRAGRKGSASDASSPDSDDDPDLDPAYAVCPRDGSNLFSAGYTMNAEKERHLRKAPHGIEAFGISPLDKTSNTNTKSTVRERKERKRPAPLTLPLPLPTPHVPATGSTSTAKTASRSTTAVSPPSLQTLNALNGPTREESEGRQEFFASAFVPAVARPTAASPPVAQNFQAKSKVSRRSSLSMGLPSFGLGVAGKAGRRSSLVSPSPTSPFSRFHQAPAHPNLYPNGSAHGSNSRTHLALSKTSSRPSTATGTERSLKSKASRSRLAGLFKRG